MNIILYIIYYLKSIFVTRFVILYQIPSGNHFENRGIVRHRPRKCEWGQFLGSIRLGEVNVDIICEIKKTDDNFICTSKVNLTKDQTEGLLQKMNDKGFSSNDYDVFENSCNSFSEVLKV